MAWTLLAREQLDPASDVSLVEWRADAAVAHHPFADRDPQVPGHQHRRRRVAKVVAVTVFLVAVADLERVLVSCRAEEADLGAPELDQGVEGDRGAVDDHVAVGEQPGDGAAEVGRDEVDAGSDRSRRVPRRRRRLEQLDLAVRSDHDQVGEGAAGVDADAVAHQTRARRSPAVASRSSSNVSSSSATPYSSRAPARETNPSRTSARTCSGGRSKGGPTAPPPALRVMNRSPGCRVRRQLRSIRSTDPSLRTTSTRATLSLSQAEIARRRRSRPGRRGPHPR